MKIWLWFWGGTLLFGLLVSVTDRWLEAPEQPYAHKLKVHRKIVSEHEKTRKRCEDLRDKRISDLTTNDQDELSACPSRENLAAIAETDKLLPLSPEEEKRYAELYQKQQDSPSPEETAEYQWLLQRTAAGLPLSDEQVTRYSELGKKPVLSPWETAELQRLSERNFATADIQ